MKNRTDEPLEENERISTSKTVGDISVRLVPYPTGSYEQMTKEDLYTQDLESLVRTALEMFCSEKDCYYDLRSMNFRRAAEAILKDMVGLK